MDKDLQKQITLSCDSLFYELWILVRLLFKYYPNENWQQQRK